MPICKNLYGVCRENISKKACHAIISFWVVEGQPGIFGGIRKCRADHDPEPGQIVALVEYPTGLRDGYMLLQRYDDMSEAIINGKIS